MKTARKQERTRPQQCRTHALAARAAVAAYPLHSEGGLFLNLIHMLRYE